MNRHAGGGVRPTVGSLRVLAGQQSRRAKGRHAIGTNRNAGVTTTPPGQPGPSSTTRHPPPQPMPPTGEERKQAKQPTRVDNTTNPDRDQGSIDDGIPVRRRLQPRHDNTPLTPRTRHADIATALRPTSRRHHDNTKTTPRPPAAKPQQPPQRNTPTPTTTTTQRPRNDKRSAAGAKLEAPKAPLTGRVCADAGAYRPATASWEPTIAVRLPEQRPRAAPSPGVPVVTPARTVRIQVP